MNIKKNILFIVFGLSLIYVLPTTAMLSKPQYTKEDKEYMEKQTKDIANANNLLLQECKKENPIDTTIATLIIERGADVNAHDELGNTLLLIICKKNNPDPTIVLSLIQLRVNVNAQDSSGNTPLIIMCKKKKPDPMVTEWLINTNMIVGFLIGAGSNVNAHGFLGMTPLHCACQYDHLEMAKTLILYRANINAQDKTGYTPLHLACQYGSNEIAQILIAHGANVNAKNFKGTTPLHFACERGTIDLVDFLLKSGADINAQTSYGKTPLRTAVESDNINICRELLKWNPDTNLTTEDGMSALDCAYDREYTDIVALFKEHGIQTAAEKKADENMIAFFKELNQEEAKKNKRKKKRKKSQLPQETITESRSLNASPEPLIDQPITPLPLTSAVAPALTPIATPGIDSPIIPSVIKKVTPATKSVPVSAVQKAKKPSPPTTPIMRESPLAAPSIAQNNTYQILIGENLRWPTSLTPNQELLIKQHLLSLKNWPHHTNLDIKKLKGEQNMFRLRVGNYRILFSVDTQRREIKIHKIGLRKKIYQESITK